MTEPTPVSGNPERKPVIDREALARVLDEEYDHYSPTYNEQGQCVSSTMADAVVASGLIEDKRAVRAEALEPIRALLEEGWLAPCGDHPEGHQHDAGGWPGEALDLIAAIVREGRA